MENFEPEIGQLMFGAPFQEYKTPNFVEAALIMMEGELDRVMWNINQKIYESPFRNTGNDFDSDVFSVHSYNWDDEEQLWNFKYGDFEVSWYKHLGRSSSMNKKISPQEISDMLDTCLKYIVSLDVALDEFEKM
jgi:hypothetical protein